MKKNYHCFNAGLGFWLLALLAWLRYSTRLALLLSLLAASTFLIQCLQHQVFRMFKKVFTPKTPATESVAAVTYLPHSEMEKNSGTIISEDVSLEGNLTVAGLITIHGEIRGNIDAKQGCVNVMRTGRVYGNIFSHEITVNGSIQGECTADIINIDENGCVHGALAYNTLNIKNGGIFSGQAMPTAKNDFATPVTLPEENIILSDKTASSHGKRSAKYNKQASV